MNSRVRYWSSNDRQTDTDKQIQIHTDRQANPHTDRYIDTWMDRWIDRQMDRNYLNSSLFHVGRCPTMQRPWTKEEGKNDCTACINANLEALKECDWRAVKFHVKNKITALKRKAFSH